MGQKDQMAEEKNLCKFKTPTSQELRKAVLASGEAASLPGPGRCPRARFHPAKTHENTNPRDWALRACSPSPRSVHVVS